MIYSNYQAMVGFWYENWSGVEVKEKKIKFVLFVQWSQSLLDYTYYIIWLPTAANALLGQASWIHSFIFTACMDFKHILDTVQ